MALFQQGTFLFDPKTDTPESVARKRQFAQAIIGNALGRAPKNVGEGLNAIGQAIIARSMGQEADAATKTGQESASTAWNPLLASLGAQQFPSAPTAPETPESAYATERVSKAFGPLGDSQGAFVSSLMPAAIEASKRTGVDPRIIVAQAAQETGWGKHAPGNNYFGIKSHGQGGGQNLATTEYVNGRPVRVNDSFRGYTSPADSVSGYADFLLQNPRYKPMMAAQGLDAQLQALGASGYATDPNYANSVGAIARSLPMPATAASNAMAAGQPIPSAPTQVASIDTSVGLPPNIDMATPRAAAPDQQFQVGQPAADSPQAQRYLAQALNPSPMGAGNGMMPPSQPPTPQQAPAAPQQPMPEMAGNNPTIPSGPSLQMLMQAASNPWLNDSQKAAVQMLIKQQMQQNDPARQLDMDYRRAQIDALKAKPDQTPDSVRALDLRAQRAGLQPGTKEYNDFMTTGGSKGVSVNVDAGSIPQGYQAVRDGEGRVLRYEPIPGGPADTSDIDAAKSENQATSSDTVIGAASKIRKLSRNPMATGLTGAAASYLPNSDAAEVYRQIEVLKSNAKVENLQAMRAASPTGGALGQVSDKENQMLADKAGALDPKSPHFQEQLDDYEHTLLRIIHGRKVGDAIFEETRAADNDWSDAGNGVKIRVKP